jgi:hypothetical protein
MSTRSIVILVIVVAGLISVGLAMRGEGAARLHHWIANVHGGR